jgi:acyl-CoA:6-aminopenicillanic acid acyl transferase
MDKNNPLHICFVWLLLILIVITSANAQSFFIINNIQNTSYNEASIMNSGSLIIKENVTILYLGGSSYEMGFQHGALLKEKAIQNLRAFLHYLEKIGFTYQMLLDCWNQTKRFIPQEYIDEMKGLSNATNISLESVGIGNIAVLFAHCSGFSAWDNATKDGLLYHMRSLDYPLRVKDPESGCYLQDNSILIIRNPNNGYISCDPSFAGFVGSLGGFNEKGIAVEVLSSWSNDETKNGIPMVFRQRMVLDYAENATQALQFLTSNKTLGWNHILSDGKVPIGFAVETSGTHHYYGTWDNPVESTEPFFSIPNIVRRTNIFINPTLAETQRVIYNPQEKPILNTILGKNRLGMSILPSFIPWIHYEALSSEIIKNYGNLDLNTTMKITRNFYQGHTNILFRFFQLCGFFTTLNQWVTCPETGDIVVSFAKKEINAFEQPIHYFNLFDLSK